MRARERVVATVVAVLGAAGCIGDRDREVDDAGLFARANGANGAAAIRCSADEDGNLYVRAPGSASVTAASHAPEGAAAEISPAWLDGEQMPRPGRPRSRSLGFIGDGKLTQAPNHGGRWDYGAHDNVLPPHAPHAHGLTQSRW